jgi:hypothetical protein
MTGRIIHDGPNYRVVHHRVSDAALVVVNFEVWLPEPAREAPATATEFFVARGINFIGIKPAANDWFQHDEILAAIAAIRAATPGGRRVGYGGSMGAFAAINFAEDLALDSLVAVCPQFSIQPHKAPFEGRWRQEAGRIAFRHDKIARIAPLRHGYILYDPFSEDRAHVRAIAACHPALTLIPIPFAGHEQLRFLTHAGLAADLLIGLVEGRFERAAMVRRMRRARGASNLIWLGAARVLLRRGQAAAALRAIERAKSSALPDPYLGDVTHAEILRLLGRKAEAHALIAAWLSDPMLGAAAHWQLAQWAPPALVALSGPTGVRSRWRHLAAWRR